MSQKRHERLGAVERFLRRTGIYQVDRKLLLAFALLSCVLVVILLLRFWPATALEPEERMELPEDEWTTAPFEQEREQERMVVCVSGEVRSPGVYELPQGSRIIDLIDAAGGFTQDANTTQINLARPLQDAELIWVPSSQAETGTGVQAPSAASPININTADETTLQTLPGVGEATARKIVADRQKNGPFKSKEDIQRVPGIGSAKFAQIEDMICV
ncbi:MAG: ComEA family DNA-binding protein [Coriobacteriales bacterium]|nr:ComEA family DNA-binding protein [Coriobacteriales bacterium]MBQ6586468.1 ComEA family DNA-binding protein [Coriobacteriales bacterium]